MRIGYAPDMSVGVIGVDQPHPHRVPGIFRVPPSQRHTSPATLSDRLHVDAERVGNVPLVVHACHLDGAGVRHSPKTSANNTLRV